MASPSAIIICRASRRRLNSTGSRSLAVCASSWHVSSIASKRPQANATAYAAANAALNALTASLAWELGEHNINVNAVCPGLAATSRWDSDLGTSRWDDMVERRVPLGRATDGDETGEFIAYLCTAAGSYINGQAINFCGGVATGY